MKRLAPLLVIVPLLGLFAACLPGLPEDAPQLAQQAHAQQPAPLEPGAITIKGDVTTIQVRRLIEVMEPRQLVKAAPFELEAPKGGLLYRWRFPPTVNGTEQGRILKVHEAPKGEVTISVQWAEIDFKNQTAVEKFATLIFFVGEPGPAPVPPDPIPPKPDPLPPAPTGFRVLFIRETADALTSAQTAAWSSGAVKDYLDAKCVKDNGHPSWRKWDKDIDVTNAPAELRQLFNDSRPKWGPLPVVVVAVNNVAKVEAFPANEAALLNLLRKYAGDQPLPTSGGRPPVTITNVLYSADGNHRLLSVNRYPGE